MTDLDRLQAELARLQQRSAEQSRQLRRLPARLSAPSAPGSLIRFVELQQNSASLMTGDLYNRRMVLVASGVAVSHLGAAHGYYFQGRRYACVRTPHPSLGFEGVEHYTIIQGGAFYAAGVLTEDLAAAGNPSATLRVSEQIEIEVLDIWGDNPPDQTTDFSVSPPVVKDVYLAIAGDRVGAQWRSGSGGNWRWEITCHLCNEDAAT